MGKTKGNNNSAYNFKKTYYRSASKSFGNALIEEDTQNFGSAFMLLLRTAVTQKETYVQSYAVYCTKYTRP